MPPLKALFPHLLPHSWFSDSTPKPQNPHRNSYPYHKRGFSTLSDPSTATTSEAYQAPRQQEWFDMEPGVGKFETSVYSNRGTTVGVGSDALVPRSAAEQDVRIPSPVRAGQPVIHKQQDFSVDVDYTDERYKEMGIPRAL